MSFRSTSTAVLLLGLILAPRADAARTWRADRLPIGPPAAAGAARAGTMSVWVDTDANVLRLDIDSVEPDPGHRTVRIVGPSRGAGDDGVRVTLPPGRDTHATWKYPDADEADLLAGRLWVDVGDAGAAGAMRGRIENLVENVPGNSTTVLTVVALVFAALGVGVVVTQRRPAATHQT